MCVALVCARLPGQGEDIEVRANPLLIQKSVGMYTKRVTASLCSAWYGPAGT